MEFTRIDRNSSVIWAKTDAGRHEIQARALVKERAQRNLLLVIDGLKTEEMLLAGLAGISRADFEALHSMGLIAPADGVRSGGLFGFGSEPVSDTEDDLSTIPADHVPLDYAQFTAALTQLISRELGLRGFVLTLAVEQASTPEELRSVAQRVLAQIAERKGDVVAAAARQLLFGA